MGAEWRGYRGFLVANRYYHRGEPKGVRGATGELNRAFTPG